MWMLYSAENWPTAHDLRSAINRLLCELGDLKFDAEHQKVYGFWKYEADYLNKLSEKYSRGIEYCEQFLEGRISVGDLVHKFTDTEMKYFMRDIKHFLPEELKHLFAEEQESSEENSEEEKSEAENSEEENKH